MVDHPELQVCGVELQLHWAQHFVYWLHLVRMVLSVGGPQSLLPQLSVKKLKNATLRW